MDPCRFDALAKHLARVPQSRRAALRRLGGAGLGAAAAGLLGRGRGQAQDATTAAATPAAPGEMTEFLYIQSHNAGTMRPKEGEAGVYELVLTGGTGHTTYFADRPQRQTGIAPTEPGTAPSASPWAGSRRSPTFM